MGQEKRDLTTGSLWKQILLFSLPLMLSNVLQVLFNMADIAVVGRFAGPMALGSVGSTSMLVSMFTGFLIGVSGGINVLVAKAYGAREEKAISQTVHTAAILSAVIGLCLLVFGVWISKWILTVLHTKDELMDGALLYIRIYMLGMPALAVYNYGNAVFSATGDTRKPLFYLSMSGVLNVILNLIFVIGFRMSVAGVALASIISQYVSAGLMMAAMIRTREVFGLRLHQLRLNAQKAKEILLIGIPAGMQNAIFFIANLFVQAGVNTFSATMVAGNSAAVNADSLVYDVMAAFYTACGSFMGQNYGAGKKQRVLRSFLICLAYSFGIGAVIGLLLVIFGNGFLSLFTSDPMVIEYGMKRLTIMGLSYGVSALMDCPIAASRALGKGGVPTAIVIMGACVFRIIWVRTVFAHFQTIPSLYLLYIFSWSITGILELLYFVKVYRQKMADI